MRINEIKAKRFKTNEPDEGWRERARESHRTADTVFPDPRGEKLKEMMLALGGWAVGVDIGDPDLEKILTRSQVWSGRGSYFMRGAPSSCHSNTASLYSENKDDVQICTGYALSKDGFWRAHSWGLHEGKPVETTEGRVAYFGFILTPEEAQEFCDSNW